MIQNQSDDPDVRAAAQAAYEIIDGVLNRLPQAKTFDYGGHNLTIGEYDVCADCTNPIAEAQQAQAALRKRSQETEDPIVREHIELAAHLFEIEAEAAIVRAEFHNGQGTEKILNVLLSFQYERSIDDDYKHSHDQGN
jgi:hypothetical protein